VNTAIRCLRQLKLKYLDGIDSLESAPAISGGVCHLALEEYGKNHWNLGDEFDKHVFEDIVLPTVLADQPQEIRDDVDFGLCKLDWNIPVDAEAVYFEEKFAVTEDWEPTDFDSDDAYVRGLMDVMFTRYDDEGEYWLEIKDWKTGYVISDSHEIQAKFYAAIGAAYYPDIENIRVTMQYTRIGVENEFFYCGDEIGYARYDVNESIKKFESIRKFRRSPSFGKCTVCDQRMHCSGFKNILNGINRVCGTKFEDVNERTISVIAEKMMVTEDTLKTLKKEMKAYTEKHGEIRVRGGAWKTRTEITHYAMLGDVYDILKDIDKLRNIKLSSSVVEKLQKRLGDEQKEEIDGIRKTGTRKSFKIHKDRT